MLHVSDIDRLERLRNNRPPISWNLLQGESGHRGMQRKGGCVGAWREEGAAMLSLSLSPSTSRNIWRRGRRRWRWRT